MTSDSEDQARLQYESIKGLIEREAEEEISQDPLSILVQSGWVEPCHEMRPEHYEILLCTGGPAVRIRGNLDENYEPESARLEHQGWFTVWTEFPADQEMKEVLLQYARHFYYG